MALATLPAWPKAITLAGLRVAHFIDAGADRRFDEAAACASGKRFQLLQVCNHRKYLRLGQPRRA